MIQRPVAIGLLLCEQIIVEEGTKSVTPVNCFTRRVVAQFPSEPLSFAAMAFLTDGLGEMPITLVIENLDQGEEVYQRSATVRFDNPLQEYRVAIRVRNYSFVAPGYYQASVLAENDFLAHRRFRVLAREHEQ